MISIQESQSVATIEECYALLDKEGASALQLPTRLRSWQLGGRAALLQFIFTWAKRFPSGALVTHIQHEADARNQLEGLCDQIHGLTAVLVCGDIRMVKGSQSLKTLGAEIAARKLGQIFAAPFGARRGTNICFLCADETSKAHLPALYHQSKPNEVKGTSDFISLSAAVLNSMREMFPQRILNPPVTFQSDLGKVLRELTKNTHQWARTDWNNVPVPRSVRGILFDCHLQQGAQAVNLASSASASPPLESYLNHTSLAQHVAEGCFAEVSVFDSGPGLARRWLGSAIGGDEPVQGEYDAIMRCLQLHGTTSRESHKGTGLDAVMRALSAQNGFLRLRTGRVCVYRDFISDPFGSSSPGGPSPATFMRDWSRRNDEITALSRAEGTLLTMLIPLPRRIAP